MCYLLVFLPTPAGKLKTLGELLGESLVLSDSQKETLAVSVTWHLIPTNDELSLIIIHSLSIKKLIQFIEVTNKGIRKNTRLILMEIHGNTLKRNAVDFKLELSLNYWLDKFYFSTDIVIFSEFQHSSR